LKDAVERLRAAGVDNPRLDARLLTTEDQIARRIAREPVAYIVGHKGFWTLDVQVGPGALVPRPETETLIETMLKYFPDRAAPLDILDLGTGTGCLIAAALSEYPKARGTGIDASEQALSWARKNTGATSIHGDYADVAGAYDVILSNPPYIRTSDIPLLAPEVRLYEPALALDGGQDGLDAYRALAPELRRLLKPSGRGFLEIGAGQGPDVAAIMSGKGLKVLEIVPDLAGIDRCVVVGR
jgi:release factor glutamine methyltransferase